jgi:hypothetical protein
LSELRVKLRYGGKDLETASDVDFAQFDTTVRSRVSLILDKVAPQISELARNLLRMRILHPERSTGRLARGTKYRRSGNGITIYSSETYGGFVEEGTRPHIIRAHGKLLHWVDYDGSNHYAKMVRHPGTAGKFYIADAVAAFKPIIDAEVSQVIAQSLKESMRY